MSSNKSWEGSFILLLPCFIPPNEAFQRTKFAPMPVFKQEEQQTHLKCAAVSINFRKDNSKKNRLANFSATHDKRLPRDTPGRVPTFEARINVIHNYRLQQIQKIVRSEEVFSFIKQKKGTFFFAFVLSSLHFEGHIIGNAPLSLGRSSQFGDLS
ncbi:hypothetical protein CDAR_372881 [Caerostris darwini]|uniref:Ribosomal protein S10 n=1 Tax=Caerostris darwini TaxID=1538125 RepID=A0AAV4RX76_9ARAC|nr:hypothetical protein CDAR_372771 [Caerostris darwini]GIY24438.1 hypothetical protein CDAR_372881 [Caerostris darwini]